jgi:hypothetical protein
MLISRDASLAAATTLGQRSNSGSLGPAPDPRLGENVIERSHDLLHEGRLSFVQQRRRRSHARRMSEYRTFALLMSFGRVLLPPKSYEPLPCGRYDFHHLVQW